jgi:hypothetical protein|tara:strand:- start:3942 stop:4274 length:333 start_codon:yes stop_codon:yes gene_type:complete
MAIIYTYPRKESPNKNDLVVITDSQATDPKFKTKSATLESLGDAGIDKNFVYTQSVPAIQWTVFHNLNKYPAVSVVNSAKEVVIGDVEYLNLDNVRITFTAAFSGQAYFN